MGFKDFIKSKTFFKHLGLIIAAFLTILIIAFQVVKLYTRHDREYEMPNIEGKTLAEIEDMSEMDRFEIVIIDSIYTDGVSGGKILTQDPKPMSKVKSGRKIYLVVTAFTGELIPMPNCKDQSVRSAVAQIVNAGLRIGNIFFSTGEMSNIVVAQKFQGKNIAANTKIQRGSEVDLIVEMNPESTTTKLPNISGMTEQEAERKLWEASLNVGRKSFDGKKDKDHSRVVSFSPSTRIVTMGTTIDIQFCNDTKSNFKQKLNSFKITENPEPVITETPTESSFILE